MNEEHLLRLLNEVISDIGEPRIKLHGIRIRPDLIIHIPFDRGTVEDRSEGNFVAYSQLCPASIVVAKRNNVSGNPFLSFYGRRRSNVTPKR